MGKITLSLCVLGVLVGFAPTAWGGYTGSLSTADGGLDGTGDWISGTSTIEWSVTQNGDQSWHYEYTLTVPGEASGISHFILEVSESFSEAHIFNASGPFSGMEIKTHIGNSPGNPNMPEDMYGIKFDDTLGTTLQFTFDAWRMPVWGDFYSKGGGGQITDEIWNAGFGNPDSDPTVGASDGSVDNHILVPDSYTPEPASLLLLVLGSLGLVRRKRT